MTPTSPLPALVTSFSESIAAKLLSKDFTVSPDGTEAVPDDDDDGELPPHAARTTATAPALAIDVRRLRSPTCIRSRCSSCGAGPVGWDLRVWCIPRIGHRLEHGRRRRIVGAAAALADDELDGEHDLGLAAAGADPGVEDLEGA